MKNQPKTNLPHRHPFGKLRADSEQAKRAEVLSATDNLIKQQANCASCL
jgi:hypothetical protein